MDEAAARDGVDRSAILKRFLRRGYADYRFETACVAYRGGQASLSAAAKMSGISVYDFLARLPDAGLELNLSPADLRRELSA